MSYDVCAFFYLCPLWGAGDGVTSCSWGYEASHLSNLLYSSISSLCRETNW